MHRLNFFKVLKFVIKLAGIKSGQFATELTSQFKTACAQAILVGSEGA